MMEIKIYDSIGQWGYSLKDMENSLLEANGKDVHVKIHSPGGDVFEGIAIYNLLKGYKGKVTTEVVGIAASMASVIFLAGEKRIVSDAGFLMIHEAWTFSMGKADDLRDDAELLDKINEQILNIYEDRTGYDREELKAKMGKETYMGRDEILSLGFATEVSENLKMVATLSNNLQLAKGDQMADNKTAPEADLNAKLAELERKILNLQEENTTLKAELEENSDEKVKEKIQEGIKAEKERATSIFACLLHEKQKPLAEKFVSEGATVEQAVMAINKDFIVNRLDYNKTERDPSKIIDNESPKSSLHHDDNDDKSEDHGKVWLALKAEGKFAEANEYFKKNIKERV